MWGKKMQKKNIDELKGMFLKLSRKNIKNLSQSEIKNHELLLSELVEKIKGGESCFQEE
jgi:hypothetical protein